VRVWCDVGRARVWRFVALDETALAPTHGPKTLSSEPGHPDPLPIAAIRGRASIIRLRAADRSARDWWTSSRSRRLAWPSNCLAAIDLAVRVWSA